MRRIIITESERKNILRSHGVILEELSLADMLASIQSAVGTTVDKKIGPDTTDKLLKVLAGIPTTTTTKFDFSCVRNNKNTKVLTDFNDETETTVFKGYQIGDFVFDKSGNYYKVNDESRKGTYTCSGTQIKLNDGTIITGEVKKDNSGIIIRFIENNEDEHSPSEIAKALLKKYSKDEIIKAYPSYEPVINSLSEIPDKQNVKPEAKVNKKQDTEDETLADETNVFNLKRQPDK